MARIGLTGLGTMGSALALNIAEKGFTVAVHNRTASVTEAFVDGAGALAERLTPAESLEDFVAALDGPRTVIVMVPAGPAVDGVIGGLLPLLSPGDLIVDAGNADFNDTRRRSADLTAKGFGFLGMGVSGGEEGARRGPSIMAGGTAADYARIEDIVTAVAARYRGSPCAAHLGPDGAGHFVKTVHNGIEYADMQLIAEVYGLLRAAGRSMAGMAELFGEWNVGPLQSYLIEITAAVLEAADPETGKPVVDVILDRAGQKGTGRWTLIEALMGNAGWAVLFAALTAFCVYEFYIVFDPAQYDKRDD